MPTNLEPLIQAIGYTAYLTALGSAYQMDGMSASTNPPLPWATAQADAATEMTNVSNKLTALLQKIGTPPSSVDAQLFTDWMPNMQSLATATMPYPPIPPAPTAIPLSYYWTGTNNSSALYFLEAWKQVILPYCQSNPKPQPLTVFSILMYLITYTLYYSNTLATPAAPALWCPSPPIIAPSTVCPLEDFLSNTQTTPSANYYMAACLSGFYQFLGGPNPLLNQRIFLYSIYNTGNQLAYSDYGDTTDPLSVISLFQKDTVIGYQNWTLDSFNTEPGIPFKDIPAFFAGYGPLGQFFTPSKQRKAC